MHFRCGFRGNLFANGVAMRAKPLTDEKDQRSDEEAERALESVDG